MTMSIIYYYYCHLTNMNSQQQQQQQQQQRLRNVFLYKFYYYYYYLIQILYYYHNNNNNNNNNSNVIPRVYGFTPVSISGLAAHHLLQALPIIKNNIQQISRPRNIQRQRHQHIQRLYFEDPSSSSSSSSSSTNSFFNSNPNPNDNDGNDISNSEIFDSIEEQQNQLGISIEYDTTVTANANVNENTNDSNDNCDTDNDNDTDDIVLKEYNIDSIRQQLETIFVDQSSTIQYTIRQFYSTTGSIQNGSRYGQLLTTYLYYKSSLTSCVVFDFLNGRTVNEIHDISSIQHLLLSKYNYNNHPLTTIDQIRLVQEIEYIQLLQYDEYDNSNNHDENTAITNLHNFWLYERGSKAAQKLQQAIDLIHHNNNNINNSGSDTDTGSTITQSNNYYNSSWKYAAEEILIQLINQYDIYWVEPIYTLGLLYYSQGQLTAAKVLFQIVLYIKPWHINTISTLVQTYSELDNHTSATLLSIRRLPPFSTTTTTTTTTTNHSHSNKDQQQVSSLFSENDTNTTNNNIDNNSQHGRRKQWVQTMIQEIMNQLQQRQHATEQLFGVADEY